MAIQTKVNLSLAFVFLIVLITSVSVIYRSETILSSDIALQNTQNTADAYFDSINIMMLSGAMANRQTLQSKILSNPDLTEARIIRGEPVASMYGEGTPDSHIQDDLDKRAMNGELITLELDDEEGHRMTVVRPMRASSNYKGTNCLTCHPVEEGTILGAVRVTYTFDKIDQHILTNIRNIALVELGLFIAALLLVGWMIHRIVLQPINKMNQTIRNIEQNADLTQQLEITSNDEIGQMSASFNSMLRTFHDSIKHVVHSIDMLGQCSQQISDVTELANSGTAKQISRAEAVTNAMIAMDGATQNVSATADVTIKASDKALQETRNGVEITAGTVKKIESLQQQIKHATDVIVQLEQQSYNIDAVLSVIQDIAEQTNLLALNAAIEAARAGEQGRGFAVVADEVRTLSLRTQNATVEINDIIGALQQNAKGAAQVMGQASAETESNVTEIQETSKVLFNIQKEMESIAETNHSISQSVKQSGIATLEIEGAVNEINNGSEQAKDRVVRLSAISTQISKLADELEKRARQFKL
ncbi:MAG: methyl-accepting chemotaxis protein [Amphritea sp.]|jgi:methyl-accepting chemotaxis protein|nr:methyl-accepting chemotaxis protein [uncultured Amphritea sp.]MDX2421735.1 methyl-accepting chemotaxis protein [Amphritea sp.]